MIKFININNGETYNGLQPYIHWFQQEMSVNLIYTHNIALLSDKEILNISIKDSEIFHIIDSDKVNVENTYKDIIVNNGTAFESTGVQIDNYFLHILYFSASACVSGQFTTSVSIDGIDEMVIGADFYDENEIAYINLSNMGVEIPQAIQKAMYSSNIRESEYDHILLNRKMKELLSNYWDIIANKGSYKSLINSLKWFEWGDLIRIHEIWKHEDFGRIIYDDRSLCSILEEKYNDSFENFSKTTHIALYVAAQKIKSTFDNEGNPELDDIFVDDADINDIVIKWSKTDLMIKLCLLGNFYETYFMPIHLNLLHATIENIVFTNTIKLINISHVSRNDYWYNINEFECNIKNDQTFILSNVKCWVNKDTFFRNPYNGETSYDDINIFGVDTESKDISLEDDNYDKITAITQFYNGVGCIVEFECGFKDNTYIIESICTVNDKKVIYECNHSSLQPLKFKLLFKQRGKYSITLQFKSTDYKIYTKNININIVDVSGMGIKLYKIKKNPPTNQPDSTLLYDFQTYEDLGDYPGHMFSRNIVGEPITQYIPTKSRKSVGLNNILVLEGDFVNNYVIKTYYYTYRKFVNIKDDDKIVKKLKYTVCISKKFNFDPEASILNFKRIFDKYVYKNEYGFVPGFHKLILLDGDAVEHYILSNELLIAVPELPIGLQIDEFDWEFYNVTLDKIYKLPQLQTPIITGTDNILDKGYYDIIFKYKMSDSVHELKLDSAFICK